MNNVKFNKQQGGLGRALAGSDYLSGKLFYTGTLPSGFTTSNNKKQIFAVSDAEALGIVNTYIDETAATATYLISTKGNTGDTATINITEPQIPGVTTPVIVNLGTYTVGSSDSSIALQGSAWAAIINANTYATGYSASFTTATLTITARKGLGIALNTGTPAAVAFNAGSAFAGTLTNFTGGVYSQLALWHYHISEYFRLQPKGNLWIGFYPVPSTYNFVELQDLQQFAKGTLRQVLIYNIAARTAAQVASDCTAIQASEIVLEGLNMPLSVVYAPNVAAITNFSTLTNLGLLLANKSSVCIAQDGGALGALLFLTSGVSITTGGALLGAISLASVDEDIAWVQKFNISNGVECDTLALSNGKLLTDPAVTVNLLNQLDSYRYIFLTTLVDYPGSYFNDSHCAIALSSDYAYIENNRTIDKAIRVGRAALLPSLNSPMAFNADGTLTNATIATFRGELITASSAMIRAGEISAQGITINPAQPALTTSSVIIAFQIVPNGVARNIIVNIGYATSITSS